ncbi:helix-turn-helix domain-containing protein [Rhizobium sp. SSA_523]|uniref:helix-turn-helix domain-containing protein n=1 Tax=Rhizobium sp. SSA_523 TaxID=2952477 RepID=UPI0020900BE0|nr:helix-turn-helix domain-containing protein [Rhizobium sp. SSA_523]MCO5730989.1 helix-turn-helix domain-containing protein [Rhizobium sp. SSA_523]WKC24205.1 helix-turn-helix domain-containing protein [Rhizobium sp. SSA_523]
MLKRLDQTGEPVTATETEAVIARRAAERLQPVAEAQQDITIHIEGSRVVVPLPARAVELMFTVLSAMANGQPISVIPQQAELSTKQAADFLNVSRPFVVKLIDEGRLPARKVNRHRRIKFADLVAFEKASQSERMNALAEMARETRDLELE